MAGHSKWSKVKHIKGPLDARRARNFSKLSKEISVASKMGGGDPAMNPRLRSAVLAARAQNMPNENIERAIKRGTGELEGTHFDEIVYEGYAPGGVAVLIEAATDNKNRTAADLRLIFTKFHGNLAMSGSVSYMFHRKGQIAVARSQANEDQLLEIILEAGAEELTAEDDHYLITTAHDRLDSVADALKKASVPTQFQKLTYVPETTVPVSDETTAAQVIRLCEALEDNDDVQNAYANFDVPEELLARLTA